MKHWQLHVDGEFIADTSIPKLADLFDRIATVWNASVGPDRAVGSDG